MRVLKVQTALPYSQLHPPSARMSSSGKTYRDEFILPDNRSVGAINIAAEKQGGLHLTHTLSP